MLYFTNKETAISLYTGLNFMIAFMAVVTGYIKNALRYTAVFYFSCIFIDSRFIHS